MAEATQFMVWIDQDLCTGDGICEEIAPDVFVGRDGLWVVREEAAHFGKTIVFHGNDAPENSAPTRLPHPRSVEGASTADGSHPAIRRLVVDGH